jgi:predicted dithiol-disulfide oxidoreductase (DUF899 family)
LNRAHPVLPRAEAHRARINDCQSDQHRRCYLPQRRLGANTCVRPYGTVYHAYSTTDRGVEFLMGYHGILERAPKGRDEGDGFQLWIRHDAYDHARSGRGYVTSKHLTPSVPFREVQRGTSRR